jgi:hypothetical protein
MSLEGKLAEIYRTLWNRDADATPRIWARYKSRQFMPREYQDSLGVFVCETDIGNGRPEVWIRRERVPGKSMEPDIANATLAELVTLSHERGHAVSFRAGTYQVSKLPEERRAWDHARVLLGELGFDEWDTFDTHRADSLAEAARRGLTE